MSQTTNPFPISSFEQRLSENRTKLIPPDIKPETPSQFILQLQPQIPELPKCPKCHTKHHVIKYGSRRSKYKQCQRFQCKNCKQTFSIEPLKRTSYPPDIIISTISKYNLGSTIAQTRNYIYRRFKTKVPKTTILSWLKRYDDICTFTSTLRKQFDLKK